MKQLLLLAGAAGLLAGCAPTLAPHTPYIPVIREKGQFEARVATGLGGSELQLGYNITNRLVLHTGLLSTGRPARAKGFRSADLGLGYYYLSPNGFWRLGLHTGLAYGGGTSGSPSCFECVPGSISSEYDVRYTYGYVQPTVILLGGARHTWGFALRVGQAYYQQLDEKLTDFASGQTRLVTHPGHTSTFVQPVLQSTYQLLPWLLLSSKFGVQRFLGPSSRLNDMSSLVAQGSLHFVLRKRPVPQP